MSRGKIIDCAYCDKHNLSNDVIGLNQKLIHMQTERILCLACMAKLLECSIDDLIEKIEEFKAEGCDLFL